MELHEALTQITEIRQQLARTEVFRGYRALPIAFSGVLALATAAAQSIWLTEPAANIAIYLALWLGAAFLSMLATGIEMIWHLRHRASTLEPEKTRLALEQFGPAIAAGGLVTLVLVRHAPESVWMLPGLWNLLFSLGIFASWRLLPKATLAVGAFYFMAGMLCLSFAQGEYALSPWAMGVPFGVGQLATAAILYWALERRHGEEQEIA